MYKTNGLVSKTGGIVFLLVALASVCVLPRAQAQSDEDFNLFNTTGNSTAQIISDFKEDVSNAQQLLAYMISSFSLGGAGVMLIVVFLLWWRYKHQKSKKQEAAAREQAEEVAKQHLQLTSHMP
jgi:hypothetical protein